MKVVLGQSLPHCRLKYAVNLRRERIAGTDDGRPYLGLEHIESATGRLIGGYDPESPARIAAGESLCNTFEPGDILFGKLRPYLAKVWVAEFAGRCTTELLVMQPKHVDPAFVRYTCLSPWFVNTVDASTFGSKMPRAEWDFIGNVRVPVPHLAQQRAIADYLNRETERIDRLIAAKEQLLALLAEKRRALITRAVTRGLGSTAPLRDSGIPWLGKIPAHWTVKRLRHISPFITVGVVVNPTSYVTPEGVPFLFGSDVTEDGIDISRARRIPPEVSSGELSKTCLRAGDLVTVRVGYPGVTAVVPPALEGANCASIMLVRGDESFDSYWLALAMNSRIGRYQVELVQYGAAQEQFNISHAVDFRFPVPPRDEQASMVTSMRRETERLDGIRTSTRRTVELLRERRAALISAAVTGALDVG